MKNSLSVKELGKSNVARVVKNPTASAEDLRDSGSIPGLGRSPGEEQGNPLLYSCPEHLMHRGAWWVTEKSMGSQRVRHNGRDLAQSPGTMPVPAQWICNQ